MGSTGCDLRHVCFVGVEDDVFRDRRVGAPTSVGLFTEPYPRPPSRLKSALRPSHKDLTRVDGEPEEPDPFFVWLLQQAQLDAGVYRGSALKRRLRACLRALKVASTEEAKALLRREPWLLARALETVLIGVTEFFRDRALFEQLRETILAELLRSRRGLRVCSIGCSDGRELYSVAMLLESLGALDGSVLMGLDCRAEAVALARAGGYALAELETVPPEFRARYFQCDGTRATIAGNLRERTTWVVGDFLKEARLADAPVWDLVLFRNLAIYLRPERMATQWGALAAQLSPGGVLVTGKAERPPAALPWERLFHCIYRNNSAAMV